MAYNYDIGFKYCYPVTYQLYPTNQLPKIQCDNNSNFNAYQNQLRKLQNREVTMEYCIRKLEYFRNLFKNFMEEIETPEELKKLLTTCKYDANKKKCFEKAPTCSNINKNKKVNSGKCSCKNCLEKLLLQLCNALSIPGPSCNKCNCSACHSRCQKSGDVLRPCTPSTEKPQKPPCYPYVPPYYCYVPPNQIQYPPSPAPAYHYYYYPQQQQQQQQQYPCQSPPSNNPSYCQQYNKNSCQPNCEMCNKCKFKYILNQLNYILSSGEQQQCTPCKCTCAREKSCCSIKEIKQETIYIKRENDIDNNVNKKRDQQANCSKQDLTELNRDNESSECPNIYSDAETTNDASNNFDELKNYSTCVKKQASILLDEEYMSPSGTFQVLIQNQANKSKPNNSSLVFEVDYITYTKPKCKVENEM